jgi:hypothetical protein
MKKEKLKEKKVSNKGKERIREKQYIKENQREDDLNCWAEAQLKE